MTAIESVQAMEKLVADINLILSSHGINETILLSDITITKQTVTDGAKSSTRLSDAITDYLWPSIASCSVYHYTSREAAENILGTGIFRLNNIERRYNDGEIVTFCKTHGLKGYLENDENGDPAYRSLIMPNTFYASFTDTNLTDEQEEYFWREFAVCNGVRLRIEVTASNRNFRKIYYEKIKGGTIALLHDLNSYIYENHNRHFILKGISRLCSFYLSGEDYGMENEYRALYRVWDSGPYPKTDGEGTYIELPLNSMRECGYQFRITEVHAFERPEMPSSYVFSRREP